MGFLVWFAYDSWQTVGEQSTQKIPSKGDLERKEKIKQLISRLNYRTRTDIANSLIFLLPYNFFSRSVFEVVFSGIFLTCALQCEPFLIQSISFLDSKKS